jgi:hypothetical protein
MPRKRLLIGVGVIVIAAVVGLLTWSVLHQTTSGAATSDGGTNSATSTAPPPPPSTVSPPAAGVPALTAARLEEIASALVSPDPPTQRTVLAAAVADSLRQGNQQVLPPGSDLQVDPATQHIDNLTATVDAAVTVGAAAGRWTLELLVEANHWVVYAAGRS